MPRYARLDVLQHLTASGIEREDRFLDHADRRRFVLNPTRYGVSTNPFHLLLLLLLLRRRPTSETTECCQQQKRGKRKERDRRIILFSMVDDAERLRLYRKFVYEVGAIPGGHGTPISEKTLQEQEERNFAITPLLRFGCRCWYFTDSGVVGTRRFVAECSTRFESHFACRHPKKPQPIAGLEEGG